MIRISWHSSYVMVAVKDGRCIGWHQGSEVAWINVRGKAGTSWRPPCTWEVSPVRPPDRAGVGAPRRRVGHRGDVSQHGSSGISGRLGRFLKQARVQL